MSTSLLSIASIIAAAIIVFMVTLVASSAVKKVKLELTIIKDMLIKVSNGSFEGDNAPPQIRESADIMSALKSIANDVKQQQNAVAHYAYIDELTGLPNKRRFDEELVRSFDFAKRGLPVCIVTAEISDIKKINSESGRSTSDRIIKILADILRKKIRKTDMSARLGSDDFAIVLPNMNESKILDWLTELSNHFISEQKVEKVLSDDKHCNVRFGYSFINQDLDRDPQQVLDRATSAMSKITENSTSVAMEG